MKQNYENLKLPNLSSIMQLMKLCGDFLPHQPQIIPNLPPAWQLRGGGAGVSQHVLAFSLDKYVEDVGGRGS